jgi:hypothetical protein
MVVGQLPWSVLIVANMTIPSLAPLGRARHGALPDAVLALFERLGVAARERSSPPRSLPRTRANRPGVVAFGAHRSLVHAAAAVAPDAPPPPVVQR